VAARPVVVAPQAWPRRRPVWQSLLLLPRPVWDWPDLLQRLRQASPLLELPAWRPASKLSWSVSELRDWPARQQLVWPLLAPGSVTG
jgi:hypothetical protein